MMYFCMKGECYTENGHLSNPEKNYECERKEKMSAFFVRYIKKRKWNSFSDCVNDGREEIYCGD